MTRALPLFLVGLLALLLAAPTPAAVKKVAFTPRVVAGHDASLTVAVWPKASCTPRVA